VFVEVDGYSHDERLPPVSILAEAHSVNLATK